MKRRVFFVIILISVLRFESFSQTAFENTLSLYQSKTGDQLLPFTGKKFMDPNYRYEDDQHMFFQSEEWQNGTLWYNDLKYINLSLKLDLVNDELILKDNYKSIELPKNYVEGFTINQHTFQKVNLSEGNFIYLQILAKNDKKVLFKKEQKKIEEDISRAAEGVKRSIKIKTYYFLQTSEGIFPLKTKKDFTNRLSSSFSKKNFQEEREKYLIQLLNNPSID